MRLPRFMSRILARIREHLALNAFSVSDLEKADRHFVSAIELAPDRQGLRYNRAVVLMGLGRFDDAESLFVEEMERFGESFAGRYALADLAWVRGNREDALARFQAVRDAAPTEKMKSFIDLRIRIAKDDDAFTTARQGADAFTEGIVAMEEKNFDRAVAKLQEAAEKDPSAFLAWNNLGVIAMNQWKDYEAAYDYFTRADALADVPVVRQNLFKLDVARTKRAQKNL